MRSERTRRAIRRLDDSHTPVIAANKTSRRAGDGLAVGRPRRSRQKILRVLACGEFLLARAVSIHYYYCVFAFTYVTTHKSEAFSVGREANPADIFQHLPRCATQHRNLVKHSRDATSVVAKIVNVVSISRKGSSSKRNIRRRGRNDLYVAASRNMLYPET